MTRDMALVRMAADVPVDEVKDLTDRILNNRPLFPDDLTPQQAAEVAMLAIAYGLDPLAGELTVYEGKPLVTLDGRIRIAAEDPRFDGIEYTRVATDDERSAFHVSQAEDMWVAAVWKQGVRFPAVGYGRAGGAYERNALVTGSKRTGYNPGRGPELARKRAMVNALRLLFPLPRPTLPAGGLAPTYVIERDDAPDQEDGSEPEALPMITAGQTRAIHAIARTSGFDTWHYRDALRRMFGVDSSQELTQAQAQAAIEAFAAEASDQQPTAEERVTARRGGDEEEFYAALEAAADASGGAEPRFFQESPSVPTDDLQAAQSEYTELLVEARGRGVSADEFVELEGDESLRQILAATELLRERVSRS